MKINRRNRLDLCTPAELAIYLAMGEVEKIGADVKLTEAVTLLAKAKDCVADFVDKVDQNKPAIHYYKCPECGKFNASNGMNESYLEEQLKNIQIHLHPKMEIPCRGEYVEITKEIFWKLAEDPKSYNKH